MRPVLGSRATTEPRRPPRASQAAFWTTGLMVSSTVPPCWLPPVIRERTREENRAGSSPLRTEFSARSIPVMEAKVVEK